MEGLAGGASTADVLAGLGMGALFLALILAVVYVTSNY